MDKKKFAIKDGYNIIVCLILVALLIGSLFLSATGAWFVKSGSDSAGTTTITLAEVNFDDDLVLNHYDYDAGVTISQPTNFTYLAPTEEIHFKGETAENIAYGGNVDAYYKVFFEISNFSKPNGSSATQAGLLSKLNFRNGTKAMYGSVSEHGSIPSGYIVFDSSAGNEYCNVSFTVTVTIQIVQADNLAVQGFNPAGGITPEEYEALFSAVFA